METTAIIIASFVATYLATYWIIKWSYRNSIGLDQPGERKVHLVPTVRIGGLGIYAGFLIALPFIVISERIVSAIFGSAIILAVGLWDDVKGINWKVKMLGIFAASTLVIFYGNIRLKHLGDLFGNGQVELGVWSIPFTYFCIIGVVNAINLIDGINGLAAGISVIAFAVLTYFAYIAGYSNLVYINMAATAALLAFLRYNFPNGRIFLGDCGSMLAGFLLATASIQIFQGMQHHYQPMLAVLILAVPIGDAVRVMAHRALRGAHPFRADETHFHHILLAADVCPKTVSASIWIMSALFGVGAILLKDETGWIQLIFLFNAYALIGIFIALLLEMRKKAQKGRKNAAQETNLTA